MVETAVQVKVQKATACIQNGGRGTLGCVGHIT
jgi:hypothetical protein